MALDGAVLAALLQSCAPNVAPQTMVAIIQVESEGNPYRIGVNRGASLQRQPANLAEAMATARGLIARGANFDAGLMQVNSSNFAALGLSAENMFDPCTNLRAGARVLAGNYQRARAAGHGSPLQAAISEYNTGSRTRGFANGYVGKVYSAAGQPYAPARVGLSWADTAQGGMSVSRVAQILRTAFGGRITDTWRPMSANYGAQNSYHKFGQAVDFVPSGGMRAITREQIRAVMAANGIELLELLGPGDRDHSDHWHVAFATAARSLSAPAPSYEPPQPWSVSVAPRTDIAMPLAANDPSEAYVLAASFEETAATQVAAATQAPPPEWDVFGKAAWQRGQSGAN